jgi:beta-glucosidase
LACNSYYQFADDIAVLKHMGATAYRMSISWPRIIPGGTLINARGQVDHSLVNSEGVAYYRAVLSAARAAGITPIVTLFHWDLPSALQTAYGGWLCAQTYAPSGGLLPVSSGSGSASVSDQPLAIVTDFANYAAVCFSALGDLVTDWATINEPQTIAVDSYEFNWYAPAAGTANGDCPSGIDYRSAHNLLLAHAAAYQVFRAGLGRQAGQRLGIVCNMDWGEPLDPTSAQDVAAAKRGNEFWGGWFWDPLFFGDYPASMKAAVTGGRLPAFTPAQSTALRGALDVLFWNTYSTSYVTPPSPPNTLVGWSFDQNTAMTPTGLDGKLIGTMGQSSWLHMVPWGAGKCLAWIQNRYSRPTPSAPGQGTPGVGIRLFRSASDTQFTSIPLIISENGFDIVNEGIATSGTTAVQDCVRVTYMQTYLAAIAAAARTSGVAWVGYTPWSLLDNFEWSHGFTARFGMTYLDFTDSTGTLLPSGGPTITLTRVVKNSAMALRDLVQAAQKK